MILLISVLTNHGVNDSLENVFLRKDTLHVLDEVVSFIDFIVLQVVDHEVEASFRHKFYERWKDLECVFTTSENDEIVSK
jgi:hypothetical protein